MHNKALRRVKLTANSIPAGDVILLQSVLLCPFFGLANFAGLFSFQLLTFVCRTPSIFSYKNAVLYLLHMPFML